MSASILIIVAACAGGVAAAATVGALAIAPSIVSETGLRRLGVVQARRFRYWQIALATTLWVVVMAWARLYLAATLPLALFGARRVIDHSARLRRQRLFEEQFEQAAATMANSLRAGQSLVQAMTAAGREYGAPLGDELRRALQEYHAGVPLIEAIEGIQRRVPCPEAAFFTRALGLHGLTGGYIAGVLGNVSRIIRQRRLLRGEVAAKSGEARLTALVLATLPLLLTAYLYVADRAMLAPLVSTTLGRVGLGYAVVSWLTGVYVINRIAASVGRT
ncbi:MAG: type II secretion system F family protein [Chloroflexota bacterium]